jgi:hypothetical protein
MSFYKFNKNDIILNTLKTYPKSEFFAYDSNVYYNNRSQISGAFTNSVGCVPSGFLNLYEYNIDRNSGSTGFIYPYITKSGTRVAFKTISTTEFDSSTAFAYGDVITGSYPLSASLYREYIQASAGRRTTYAPRFPPFDATRYHVDALKNTLDYYTYLSNHYAFSSSYGDKAEQEINLISIPSIFFGSGIQKGSVSLKFLVSGSIVGELQDIKQNGELIQIGPSGSTGSGSVAGVVLYAEGFLVLTGSWQLEATARNYLNNLSSLVQSKWVYFGNGLTGSVITPSGDSTMRYVASHVEFKGTNNIPVMTMFCNAPKGELNYSNNPTFVEYGKNYSYSTSSTTFVENTNMTIKNTISSSYADPTGSFTKQVFISQVGIFDEQKNLIGIAKVAKPVKKTEERDLTFKIKLDL